MERNKQIEYMRIIAIIMVIIIHVSNIYCLNFNKITNTNYLIALTYNSISRVSVPIFFMISGSLLIEKTYTKEKYLKRIFKFLNILIIWSIIYFLINKYIHLKNITLINTIFTSLFTATKTQRHLWYLYAIIGIYLVLPFIQSMCKNLKKEQENLFIILFIIFSGLSVIYTPLIKHITNTNIDIQYPVPIVQGTYYLGYFISGHIIYKRFKNNELKILNKKRTPILLFILSTTITILTTFIVSNINHNHYEVMLWYKSIFTILASYAIFIIILNKKNIKQEKLIENISNHTFGIYLIHMIFLNIIKEIYSVIEIHSFIGIPIITTLVFILSLISCIFIKKIPYLKKIIS